MINLVDLTGKKILIMGASSGIGKESAVVLSQLGASTILVARRIDKLEETRRLLEGDNHFCYSADLSVVEEIDSLIKRVVVECGKLDGMVYAAGVGSSMPLMQFKPDRIQEVFRINYFGFIECVRQICRKGRFNAGMRIVGISSIASLMGDKAHLAYSGSKAAMDASVRCIAKEVAEKGICINTVAPAMTATEMYEKYKEKYGVDSDSNQDLLKRQYLGIAQTDDIANAVAFLISSAARFITGVCLPIDGGFTSN